MKAIGADGCKAGKAERKRLKVATGRAEDKVELTDPSTDARLPACIVLLRHGEKPDADKDRSLSPAGAARAQALATILPQRFPSIRYLFAAEPTDKSERSKLTLEPVAERLALSVETPYKNKDYDKLARELLHEGRYAGRTVVIAWNHSNLPELARALGVKDPQTWPSDTYDRLWQIGYDSHGQASLQTLSQN